MAWKGRRSQLNPVDFASLKSILVNAKLQIQNQDLYLFLDQFLDKVAQSRNVTQTQIDQLIGDVIVTQETNLAAILALLANLNNIIEFGTFLTAEDESIRLPSSRHLIAGAGIIFDDTVPNERTISSAAGATYYAPLTDGDIVETDLIFAAGECIMVPILIP